MFRTMIVLVILGIGTAGAARRPALAWPLRATVTGPNGRAIELRAVSLGGDLIFKVGEKSNPNRPFDPPVPVLRALPRGDTLRATTPAEYALDLARGPVVFFTSGRDSLRVVVGRNPYGAINPASGQGRRLKVRLVKESVVIYAQ
jgi:hypothetical protein